MDFYSQLGLFILGYVTLVPIIYWALICTALFLLLRFTQNSFNPGFTKLLLPSFLMLISSWSFYIFRIFKIIPPEISNQTVNSYITIAGASVIFFIVCLLYLKQKKANKVLLITILLTLLVTRWEIILNPNPTLDNKINSNTAEVVDMKYLSEEVIPNRFNPKFNALNITTQIETSVSGEYQFSPHLITVGENPTSDKSSWAITYVYTFDLTSPPQNTGTNINLKKGINTVIIEIPYTDDPYLSHRLKPKSGSQQMGPYKFWLELDAVTDNNGKYTQIYPKFISKEYITKQYSLNEFINY